METSLVDVSFRWRKTAVEEDRVEVRVEAIVRVRFEDASRSLEAVVPGDTSWGGNPNAFARNQKSILESLQQETAALLDEYYGIDFAYDAPLEEAAP